MKEIFFFYFFIFIKLMILVEFSLVRSQLPQSVILVSIYKVYVSKHACRDIRDQTLSRRMQRARSALGGMSFWAKTHLGMDHYGA